MQYVVNKSVIITEQIAVTAESPEEAVAKVRKQQGKSISRDEQERLNAHPRPEKPAVPQSAQLAGRNAPPIGK